MNKISSEDSKSIETDPVDYKRIRPIAIHLPQFHPIPENDKWWGKGFTEWTNVAKAKPLFNEHYQPHLPADLGFYDLRLEEARVAQAELAKEHGIYGFCYYHYWFNGKRLLERPLEDMLKTKTPDFPFMLCWANENWTRRWDGGENIILMKQEYSELDAINHCKCLIPFFNDTRHIKIESKPVFAIYKPQLIPNLKSYVTAFRNEALKNKIELYICNIENNEIINNEYFDAAIEFQPYSKMLESYINDKINKKIKKNISRRVHNRILNSIGLKEKVKLFHHQVNSNHDYNEYVDFLLKNYSYPSNYKRFPGITPMWDNTARRGKEAFLFKNSSPEKYGEWLSYHAKNFQPFSKGENFIFINAWNEWAEGNHLEPCMKWGRSYLSKTKDILSAGKVNSQA